MAVVNNISGFSKIPNGIYETLFKIYENPYNNLINEQIRLEDLDGESFKHCNAMAYQIAYIYVMLIHRAIKEGIFDLNTVYERYEVAEISHCFSCMNISIEKLFKALKIDFSATQSNNVEGIEHIEIEETFQVEKAVGANNTTNTVTTSNSTIDISSLLSNPINSCNILIS